MSNIVYNPLSPVQMENPYPIYDAIRTETPAYFSPIFGMWVITRFDDVNAVLKDTTRFSSMNSTFATALPQEVLDILATAPSQKPALVDNDPPSHTRLRSLFNKVVTPKKTAAMEPEIERISNRLIDAFIANGEADLMKDFAFWLPGFVITSVLGFPDDDLATLKKWGDDALGLLSAATLSKEQLIGAANSRVEFIHYLLEKIAVRRQAHQGDWLSDLVATTFDDGTAPDDMDLVSCVFQMMNAGHETTTDLIGSALVLLLNHPDQLKLILDNPDLTPNAVEEILRMEAPVQGLFRTTTEEVTLSGVTIPTGQRLQVLYAAANRDATQFENPHTFDIQRKNAADHISFGKGIHFCLGASLARLEATVALRVIFSRLKNLRYGNTAPVRQPHFFLRGYASLPLAWDNE
jgi:cytochrome P450